MQKRKKRELDGIDREILRLLYGYSPLVSSKIAKCVGLSASAIAPRLNSLKEQGIIKYSKVSGTRKFKRDFGGKKVKINSPRSIFWEIDLEVEK